MNKKEIRKKILSIRDNLLLTDKIKMDKIIKEKFLNSEEYKKAKKIFIYISFKSEVDTKEIILQGLRDKKEIIVPRTDISNKIMDGVKINSFDNLKENVYGILEPAEDLEAVEPNDIDLIVMPGSAFDKNKSRIGYGAGYYDKYLKSIGKKKATKIALAYDFQIVDNIPSDKHDVPVDYVITNDKDIR